MRPEDTYGRSTVSSRNRSLSPERRAKTKSYHQSLHDTEAPAGTVPWISPGVGETHWHAPGNTSISNDMEQDDDRSTKKGPVYLFENH